jgi:shikimate dehydrogenase
MTRTAPAVIVSIPARSVSEARAQIPEARNAGADLVEVRLDRFPEEQLSALAALFPSPVPLIATLRSRAEGGEGPDGPEERAGRLTEIAHHPFRWLDAELARDFPSAESLARPGVQDLVVSTHLLNEAPAAQWRDLLRQTVPKGSVRKVVVRASVGHLLREFLPAIPPPEEGALVAQTTGGSGPLLRAWSGRFGFPFVYASLPEPLGAPSSRSVEPSQIPVDRLKPFLTAEGAPPLFAITGHPVAHSRSPALFARWMHEDHRVGLYVALDFESEQEFADALPALAEGGFRGISVTHPFKAIAGELADEVGPGAAACGVANTLTFRSDGIASENTDLAAILRRLQEIRSTNLWDGGSVGVIGAGGAARATLAAARTLGVEAYVWARRSEAAESLAQEFGAHPVRTPDLERPSLVVHATPVGRTTAGVVAPPGFGWLRSGIHAIDWVYAPDEPTVRIAAERVGATYEDGRRLLVYQGAASYGIWWGNEPSPDQVSSAIGGFR